MTIAMVSFFGFTRGPSTSFDSERWRNINPQYSDERVSMVDDLIAHHLPKGLHRVQVHRMIGEPDNTQSDIEVYTVGERRSSPFREASSVLLYVEFDSSGNVTSAQRLEVSGQSRKITRVVIPAKQMASTTRNPSIPPPSLPPQKCEHTIRQRVTWNSWLELDCSNSRRIPRSRSQSHMVTTKVLECPILSCQTLDT